jgi:hypothetical protein
LPRKYRPPARRRKTQKSTIPYEFQQADQSQAEDGAEEAADAPLTAVGVAEAEPEPEIEERAPRRAGVETRGERHIARDFSYVRSELLRIAAIATFLIVALAITAYFR